MQLNLQLNFEVECYLFHIEVQIVMQYGLILGLVT